MDHTSLTCHLPDGRYLGYALYGSSSPTAAQIVYLHSFPSSRLEGAILASHAVALNIRLICPDRPGIGFSTASPGRKIMDFPTDLMALVNFLQVQTFSIVAYSAGMPYALACMLALPRERLRGVDIAAGAFPAKVTNAQVAINFYYWPMRKLLQAGATHLVGSSLNSQYGSSARDTDPTKFYEVCEKEMHKRPDVEQKALAGVEKVVLWDPLREAMRSGVDESAAKKEITLEVKLQTNDWGFKLNDGPWDRVTLWHGDKDANCPLETMKYGQRELGCELRVLEGHGHVGVLVYFGMAILQHALERLRY